MINILRFWRNKSIAEKEQIKKDHNIKVITYKFIQELYLEKHQL